jgi:peptidylprolyl isomerase
MTSSLASRQLTTLGSAVLTALLLTCCKGSGATKSDAGSHDGGDAAASAGLPAPADVAAPPSDAARTASGVAYRVLAPGTGTAHPSQNDSAKVNFSGWTTDGKMFDSSVAPVQPGRKPGPATMPLNRLIPGWSEAIQLMVVGEKGRFWIPEELAYKNRPGAPQGMLVFDIELIDFQ